MHQMLKKYLPMKDIFGFSSFHSIWPFFTFCKKDEQMRKHLTKKKMRKLSALLKHFDINYNPILDIGGDGSKFREFQLRASEWPLIRRS